MAVSTFQPRRVVITGMGVISPLGMSKEALWSALVAGKSGVAPVASLPVESMLAPFAAEAREFTGVVEDFGPLEGDQKKATRKALKVMCRETQMGVAAAQRAFADAGVSNGNRDPERTGVVFGTDYMLTLPDEFGQGIAACVPPGGDFDFTRWAAEGMGKMSPLWLLKYLPNMPASHIAIFNDLRGPNNSITHREAAGNLAIGEAFRVIARGHADMIVAGATGTRVHPMKTIHTVFGEQIANGKLAPEKASRPFDAARAGMVMGEGAAAVVLEDLESAKRRGATILAEVVGSGGSAVADRKSVAHRDTAMVNATRAALRDAKIAPSELGHIQAHGLGTRTCDIDEAKALTDVLGASLSRIPVTAAKSYFGNLGAGSGVVELAAGVMALANGRLFPILNYETPDPECPILAARDLDTPAGDSFANLSVTPQGQASCIVVRKFG